VRKARYTTIITILMYTCSGSNGRRCAEIGENVRILADDQRLE